MERSLLPMVVVGIVAAASAGCGFVPGGVNVPLGSESLAACPTRQLMVTELDKLGRPGCNLEGSIVTFADGTQMTVGEVGGVLGQEEHDVSFILVNWGLPGVGAAMIRRSKVEGVWATSPEALALQYEQLRVEGIR